MLEKVDIVVGSGFGDEGKGLVTSALVSDPEYCLVIRFNGGHQAGHTVHYKNESHVFSSFGSGTLQGASTYWSEYCTFSPIAFINEFHSLKNPKIFVHPLCPIVTPYDEYTNQEREKINNHGSVGVGFGTTVERHTTSPYKLHFMDLLYDKIWKEKLKQIASYYIDENSIKHVNVTLKDRLENFANSVDEIQHLEGINVFTDNPFTLLHWNQFIFEGAQGILLDMDFGFFPNVTRSHTTSRNALKIIKKNKLPKPTIYYVSRCYQTRHGNGYMSDERELELVNAEQETNQTHKFQGKFRKGLFDLDLFSYALQCDSMYSKNLEKRIVVTCCDQISKSYLVDGKIVKDDLTQKLMNKFRMRVDKTYNSKTENLFSLRY